MMVRNTIQRHTGELRYLDPATMQIQQAVFLVAIALSLLMSDVFVKFGYGGAAMRWVYTRWPDADLWSAVAGALGLVLVVIPQHSTASRILLLCTCIYWSAFAARMTIVFGWAPISSAFAVVLGVLSAWAYVRGGAHG
jgi:hypothetical protein